MAGKQIIWSSHARSELKNVLEFYNKRNGNNKYSLKLLSALDSLLKTLSENPLVGRLSSNKKTRVLVMGVFLIFYDNRDPNIRILSFWDNRRNPEKRIDQ